MKKPTDTQIAAEIAALKKLKPVGPFARKTAETIAVVIDALDGQIDETAPEFSELTDDQQMAAVDAMRWKNGYIAAKPTADWDGLCA
jgi:DNA-directed RNA polymerase specialized sigma54-like protein